MLVPRQTTDLPRERPPLLEHIRPENTSFPTQEPTNSSFLPGKGKVFNSKEMCHDVLVAALRRIIFFLSDDTVISQFLCMQETGRVFPVL